MKVCPVSYTHLSQTIKLVADIKESTLYPILKKLEKAGYVTTYSAAVSYTHLDVYKRQNLICVEDGIDSSKDSGKLMISVLSAVAEIERENILVQTMEGRKQKAREGKWNGGFAPYGYELVNGELQIAEDVYKRQHLVWAVPAIWQIYGQKYRWKEESTYYT